MTDLDYDPFSSEVLADPGPHYAALLESCPVHRYDGFDPPFYSLSRHDDVRDALRDVATYSSHYGQGPNMTVPGSMQSDPPQHTFFRRQVQQAFTARAVNEMQPRIEALVDELIAGFIDRGEADIHDELAYPLPTIVIAQMLGVPEQDREVFKEWSDASVAAMSSRTPEVYRPQLEALNAYLIDQARHRLALEAAGEPLPDDLISRLVTAEQDGRRVGEADTVALLGQLLVGGNETTTSLITNALVRLTDDPANWERLRAEPDLVEVAVEESLRFDPPVLGLFRTTTCPVQLHGEEIPERAKVMLLYAAANRDPRVFDDPNTFSLDRDLDDLRRHHLSFGYGIHFCIGAALARMEARITLAAMVEQFSGLRMTAMPERIAPFLLWGKKTLPMAWEVARGAS
ncbi:MAG: cytochrome P450 [Ilumatobacteraceae bacterium]